MKNTQSKKVEEKIIQIESDQIRSILLTRWDYCWLTIPLGLWNGKTPISRETEEFLSKYTLVDELPRKEKIGNRIEIKLNYFSVTKIVVLTSSFNILNKVENEPLICSFCVVFKESIFPKVIEFYSVITNHVERLSRFYKSLHSKYDECETIEKFDFSVQQFSRVFNSLCTCGLQKYSINETVFKGDNSKFLSVSISSHLKTHGYSVIVGTDLDVIRYWVNSVSLFLLPKERRRCRQPRKGVSFDPELFVQGILVDNDTVKIKDIVPIRNILFGSFPVTIIDLRKKKVFAFKKYNFFTLVKTNYQYLYDTDQSNDAKSMLNSKHIEETKSVCPSVVKMLDCLFSIPEYYREGYISEWIRLLNRKALTLTKLINEYGENVNKINIDDLLKKIDCNKNDKLVILASSEKIQTGVYIKVQGNLTEEVETIIDFLENSMIHIYNTNIYLV